MARLVRPGVGAIRAPLLYVLSRTDALYPPSLSEPTIELLRNNGVQASYFEIDSEYGHYAPSSDWHRWERPLGEFLQRHAR